jgi:hypothetical protein
MLRLLSSPELQRQLIKAMESFDLREQAEGEQTGVA